MATKKERITHPLKLNAKQWDKQKVMAIVCTAIATSSRSVSTILDAGFEGNTLPDYSTVKDWLAADESIAAQYARAKEDQADYMAEEMLDIADDGRNDWMEKKNGDGEVIGYVLNSEHVQRSRLRIESRKWLMGKLRPKKYGDKVTQEIGGIDGAPISLKVSFE